MALGDNLKAHYNLDSNANDSLGLSNGTETSINHGTAGILGNAALSDDANDRIYFGNPSAFQFSGSTTVNMWVKGTTQGANNRSLWASGGIDGAGDAAIGCFHYSGIYFSFFVSDGSTYKGLDLSAGQTSGILDNSLHMLTFVYTAGSRVEVFKDGSSLANSTTGVPSTRQTTKNWSIYKIGTDQSASARDACQLLVDEFAIFDKALDSTEISELYNSGAGLAYPYPTTSASGSLLLLGVS